jgi:hypothetical protein
VLANVRLSDVGRWGEVTDGGGTERGYRGGRMDKRMK